MRFVPFLLLVTATPVWAGQLVAPKAAVATASREASEAALDVMREGGNAFDAAVVAALVLGGALILCLRNRSTRRAGRAITPLAAGLE